MKKIFISIGTRPEAIKMAPIIKLLKNDKEVELKVCVTAQHRNMLDQVLKVFDIIPDYDLNVMKPNQDLFDITGAILSKIKEIFNVYIPDIVLVQGDTTTAFVTGLAAYYKKIKVGHIEAGLRTGNIYSPFPEELNRQLISRFAKFHFCPTEASKNNLLSEFNNSLDLVFVTGNTVIDALMLALEKIENDKYMLERISKELFDSVGFDITKQKYILVTGHRRENFGEGFLNICNALKEIANNNKDIYIVYPVHLNPNVQKPVFDILNDLPNIILIKPLDYLPFVYLMNKSYIIMTDSGGIQEEAPSLGKPVLVMRDTTERQEAIVVGTAKLVGTNKEKIINEVTMLLNDENIYKKMSNLKNPYGDGMSAKKIIDILKLYL